MWRHGNRRKRRSVHRFWIATCSRSGISLRRASQRKRDVQKLPRRAYAATLACSVVRPSPAILARFVETGSFNVAEVVRLRRAIRTLTSLATIEAPLRESRHDSNALLLPHFADRDSRILRG